MLHLSSFSLNISKDLQASCSSTELPRKDAHEHAEHFNYDPQAADKQNGNAATSFCVSRFFIPTVFKRKMKILILVLLTISDNLYICSSKNACRMNYFSFVIFGFQ